MTREDRDIEQILVRDLGRVGLPARERWMGRPRRSPLRWAFAVPAVALLLVGALAAGVALEGRRTPADQPTPTVAPAASATPKASPEGPQVYQVEDFGYTIEVPEGWRHSERLSTRTGDPIQLGHDLFTARTPEDEEANLGGHTFSPAFIWAVTVRVEKDPDGLTPRQWHEEGHLGGSVAEIATDITFDGRPALRIENGATATVAIAVARADDKVVISYSVDDQAPAPPGVTRDVLEQIIASVKLSSEAARVASSTPSPTRSTVPGLETSALGDLSDEWIFLTRLRSAEGGRVRAELWAVERYGTRRLLAARWEEPRSLTQTVLRRQLAPSGRQIVLSTPDQQGGTTRYRLTIVDFVSGRTDVLTDGNLGRDTSPAWSPDGRTIAFIRTDALGDGRELWTIQTDGGSARRHASGNIQLLGWTADGSGIAYTDDATLKVLAPGGATVEFARKVPVDSAGPLPIDWRRSSSMFQPQLVGVFATDIDVGTRAGGDVTIEIAERDGSGQRAIFSAPKALFQPRWDPTTPRILYRNGHELWIAGALEPANPRRVAIEGRVLRAEWQTTQLAEEGIVYILDGPEDQDFGASVHIAFDDGTSARTIFTAPDDGGGMSDIEDIATARIDANTVADPRGAAREQVDIEGRPYVIGSAYLWRDFMPISPPDGKPLIGSIRVRIADNGTFPAGPTVDRVWVYGPEIWEATPTEIRRAPEGGTSPNEIEVVVRDGPKWEPGTKVDVVIRMRSGGFSHYLKLTGVTIERTQ